VKRRNNAFVDKFSTTIADRLCSQFLCENIERKSAREKS